MRRTDNRKYWKGVRTSIEQGVESVHQKGDYLHSDHQLWLLSKHQDHRLGAEKFTAHMSAADDCF